MFANTNHKMYRSDNPIDGTATGSSTIETTDDTDTSRDVRFVAAGIQLEITDAANILVPALISIGTNSPDYNNIAPSQLVGGLLNKVTALATVADKPILAEGTVIKLKVITAAQPVPLTTVVSKFKAIVYGWDLIF